MGASSARSSTSSRPQSHERAGRAIAEGRFKREIAPLTLADGSVFDTDEGVRVPVNREKMAALAPSFKPDGVVTAANSSQISDGAAALLIMSETRARALGLTPRARIVATALAGVDPTIMLTGPIPATQRVLKKAGMKLDQIDLFEINEAFASVVLAWERELHPDMARVNVNGGRDRARPPARLLGRQAHDDAAARAGADARSVTGSRRCASASGRGSPPSSSGCSVHAAPAARAGLP